MLLSSLQKGLVFHAPLSEERYNPATKRVDDLTPYENHGTANAANLGVFVADRMGQADRAMKFDGTDDRIDITIPNANLTSGTVSMWIEPNSDTCSQRLFYSGSVSKIEILYGANDIRYQIFNGDWTSVSSVKDDFAIGTWYHLLFTWDGTTNKIYIDGIFDNDVADNAGEVDLGAIQLGGRTSQAHFNGSIADVRIYNRAISQQEITALYEQYRPKLSLGSLQKGLVLDMPLTLTSTMTAMVWVKGAGQATKGIFAHLDNATNQRGFLLYTSGISPYTKFRIFLSDNGQNIAGHKKEYISSIITFDGTWHLIGFTFDAGILKLFVNGVEDANPTKSTDDPITTIHDSTADIMVGCFLNSDTPVGFFDGDLAYARMYNRALTNAEWLLAFEKQKGAFL
jgi:hypothetical protein